MGLLQWTPRGQILACSWPRLAESLGHRGVQEGLAFLKKEIVKMQKQVILTCLKTSRKQTEQRALAESHNKKESL